MRKPDFCLCENKDADQLRSMCNPFSTRIQNFKLLCIFCDCTDRFVSNLVGNPEDRLSRDAAQVVNVTFVSK